MFLRSEVVAHDRLHAHRQSQYNHYVKHQQPVHDAVSTDSHIAAITLQAVVHDDNDDACRYIHQERRHPYGENAADNTFFHLPEARVQAYDACLLQEVAYHPYHADKLRNDRCRCRSADTPVEVEDEDRGENNVAHHRNHRGQHRFLGITRGTHDVVQPYHRICHRRTQQNYLHEVPRIRQRFVAGAEKAQDFVQEDKRDTAEQE